MSELSERQVIADVPTTEDDTSLWSWRWSEQTAGDLEAQAMLREVRDAVCSPERLLMALRGGVDDD